MAKASEKTSTETLLGQSWMGIIVYLIIISSVMAFGYGCLKFPKGQFREFMESSRVEIPTFSSQAIGVTRDWTSKPIFKMKDHQFAISVLSSDSPLNKAVPYQVRVNRGKIYDGLPGQHLDIDTSHEEIECFEFRIKPGTSSSVTTLHLRLSTW